MGVLHCIVVASTTMQHNDEDAAAYACDCIRNNMLASFLLRCIVIAQSTSLCEAVSFFDCAQFFLMHEVYVMLLSDIDSNILWIQKFETVSSVTTR